MDTPATLPFPSSHYIFASLTMLCLVTCNSTDCISRDTDFESQPIKVYDVKLKLRQVPAEETFTSTQWQPIASHYSHFRCLVNLFDME